MSNDVIFWTQIATIVGFLAALFIPYRLMIEQKEATIQNLKEQLAAEKDKVEELKSQAPDAVAEALNFRIGIMESELIRLRSDDTAKMSEIRAAKSELEETSGQLRELRRKAIGQLAANLARSHIGLQNAAVPRPTFASELFNPQWPKEVVDDDHGKADSHSHADIPRR